MAPFCVLRFLRMDILSLGAAFSDRVEVSFLDEVSPFYLSLSLPGLSGYSWAVRLGRG